MSGILDVMSITELRDQASRLSAAEQDELIRELLILRDGATDVDRAEVDAAWVSEAERRADELSDGSVRGIASAEVRRQTAQLIADAR